LEKIFCDEDTVIPACLVTLTPVTTAEERDVYFHPTSDTIPTTNMGRDNYPPPPHFHSHFSLVK
jgi:hypothetical protein